MQQRRFAHKFFSIETFRYLLIIYIKFMKLKIINIKHYRTQKECNKLTELEWTLVEVLEQALRRLKKIIFFN